MPKLTRWYLRTALIWLVAALALGGVNALRPVVALQGVAGALGPLYVHFFMLGWVAQLIFGVVHWMFPKPDPARAPRGERLGWLTWLALNAGLVLRAFGEPAAVVRPGTVAAAALTLSALLQVAAGWLFVATTWPRVRSR